MSAVAGQQVLLRSGHVLAMLAFWSSIVPTFCCTDDLQDTRYFMELICSVPAEPLPMQILTLANNAGKANRVMPLTLFKALNTMSFAVLRACPGVVCRFQDAASQFITARIQRC